MLKHQWHWRLLISFWVGFGGNLQPIFCQNHRQLDSLSPKKVWMVMVSAAALDNPYVYYGLPMLIYQPNQHGVITGTTLIPTEKKTVRPGLIGGYFFNPVLRKKLVAVTLETFVTVLPYASFGFVSVTGGFGLRLNLAKRLFLHHFIGMGGRYDFVIGSGVEGVAQLRLGLGYYISQKRNYEG